MVGDWFDPLDPRPPYRQLAAIIRGQVDAGEFGPGDMIPSEKTLEQTYGVARDTARKVAAVLRDEGVAVTIPGRGTFVRRDYRPKHDEEPEQG